MENSLTSDIHYKYKIRDILCNGNQIIEKVKL